MKTNTPFRFSLWCILCFCAFSYISAQDEVFHETFADEAHDTTAGIDEHNITWSCTCPSKADFCGVDTVHDHYAFQNLDGPGTSGDTAVWLTDTIAIPFPQYASFSLFIDVAEYGAKFKNFKDCITIEYSINGPFFLLAQLCGEFTRDTFTFDKFPINKNAHLVLRISCYNNDAPDIITIEEVIVWANPLVLPVELIEFTAKREENSSVLLWQTATEINNAYFEIQRSGDGFHFENIGKVPGAGTTSGLQNYTFTDHTPLSGLNYYRLKQVDFDGAFEYSPTRVVDFRTEPEELSVFPIPTSDVLNIVGNNSSTICIYDMTGRRVMVDVSHDNTINVSHLPAGQYVMQVGQKVKRFVKE